MALLHPSLGNRVSLCLKKEKGKKKTGNYCVILKRNGQLDVYGGIIRRGNLERGKFQCKEELDLRTHK